MSIDVLEPSPIKNIMDSFSRLPTPIDKRRIDAYPNIASMFADGCDTMKAQFDTTSSVQSVESFENVS